MSKFTPHHLNATSTDLLGNDGIGRYVLLPGSDGRAKDIAKYFNNLEIKSHPRGHHLYLGTISDQAKIIAVATVASGMGCPSMEIILHELFHLGAKRFLRVGTAGSLQPKFVTLSNVINVQAAVRDEQTTADYVPVSVPAIASFDFMTAIIHAANQLNFNEQLHTGIVHCKSSLYAGEFGAGPKSMENKAHLEILKNYGVLASEMETAALFIQSQFYHYQLMQKGESPQQRVLAGAILSIISVPPENVMETRGNALHENKLISLAIESIKTLARTEM